MALQGDIIYSDGIIKLDHVTLVVRRARDGVSVLRHSGPERLSINVTSIRVYCPSGYDLRTTNSTSYRVCFFFYRDQQWVCRGQIQMFALARIFTMNRMVSQVVIPEGSMCACDLVASTLLVTCEL